MSTKERVCPDCQSALHEVKILDTAHYNVHTNLEYAVPEAKRSFWTVRYPVAGQVAAFMCEGCGRILLYGVPTPTE